MSNLKSAESKNVQPRAKKNNILIAIKTKSNVSDDLALSREILALSVLHRHKLRICDCQTTHKNSYYLTCEGSWSHYWRKDLIKITCFVSTLQKSGILWRPRLLTIPYQIHILKSYRSLDKGSGTEWLETEGLDRVRLNLAENWSKCLTVSCQMISEQPNLLMADDKSLKILTDNWDSSTRSWLCKQSTL